MELAGLPSLGAGYRFLRRAIPVVLAVDGRGEVVLEVAATAAPVAAEGALARLAGRTVTLERTPDGLVLPLGADLPGLHEISRSRIRAGTIVVPPGRRDRVLIVTRPRPEWEGVATVLGRAELGVRLIPTLETGDRASVYVY
jgi:hypothetical protein